VMNGAVKETLSFFEALEKGSVPNLYDSLSH